MGQTQVVMVKDRKKCPSDKLDISSIQTKFLGKF